MQDYKNLLRIRPDYGAYSMLFNKAELVYNEWIGAGAIVYLRKIFEKITV